RSVQTAEIGSVPKPRMVRVPLHPAPVRSKRVSKIQGRRGEAMTVSQLPSKDPAPALAVKKRRVKSQARTRRIRGSFPWAYDPGPCQVATMSKASGGVTKSTYRGPTMLSGAGTGRPDPAPGPHHSPDPPDDSPPGLASRPIAFCHSGQTKQFSCTTNPLRGAREHPQRREGDFGPFPGPPPNRHRCEPEAAGRPCPHAELQFVRLRPDGPDAPGRRIVLHPARVESPVSAERRALYNGDLMLLRSPTRRGMIESHTPDQEDPFPYPAGPRSWKSRVRIALLTIGGFGLVGLFQANVIYFLRLAGGDPVSPLLTYVNYSMIGMAAWVLISPLIVAFARRFPVVGRAAWWHAMLHLVVALGAHVVLNLGLMYLRTTTSDMHSPLLAKLISGTLWDLIFYTMIVAVAHAIWLRQDARRRKEESLWLRGELAQSRFEALTLQLQPHFL